MSELHRVLPWMLKPSDGFTVDDFLATLSVALMNGVYLALVLGLAVAGVEVALRYAG